MSGIYCLCFQTYEFEEPRIVPVSLSSDELDSKPEGNERAAENSSILPTDFEQVVIAIHQIKN